MTSTGPPLPAGELQLGPPVVVAVGGGAIRVGDLLDVDAPPDQPGVLERYGDGRVRATSRTALLAPHVNAPAPHPAYDDMPSLRLLFENGLI